MKIIWTRLLFLPSSNSTWVPSLPIFFCHLIIKHDICCIPTSFFFSFSFFCCASNFFSSSLGSVLFFFFWNISHRDRMWMNRKKWKFWNEKNEFYAMLWTTWDINCSRILIDLMIIVQKSLSLNENLIFYNSSVSLFKKKNWKLARFRK